MDITVLSGDITQVSADALITAVNPAGVWNGGIDKVIRRVADNFFHDQARRALPLDHGDTVVASGVGFRHNGAFKSVVFVIDAVRGPLALVVEQGLTTASNAGYASVTLPTIRMGMMIGLVEKTAAEAIDQMAEGVTAFLQKNIGTPIKSITFVVHGDAEVEAMLKQRLATVLQSV